MVAAARKAGRRARWERAGAYDSVHSTPPGSAMTPFTDAMAHWDEDVEVDIDINDLTTRFEESDTEDYRSTIMKYDENAFRMERRAAGSDPPMATFETSEQPVQPKKRMLAIPFTYEHLRQVRFIDKAMEHVEEIAVQQVIAKVDEGLEAMLHGAGGKDLGAGKDNGAQLIRLQDLDSSATDAMTPRAWLTLQKKFKRSYMLTSCIAPDENITDLQLAKIAGTNVMMVTMNERQNAVGSGFGGGFRVMNQLAQGVSVGWHEYLKDRILETKTDNSTVKHNALIVYDKRKAVEFVSQTNSDIKETTRDMLKQVEFLVCSETWCWSSYQPKRAITVVCLGNPAADSTLSIVE